MFLCEILYVEGVYIGEYMMRLTFDVNLTLRNLWRLLEDNNVMKVEIDVSAPSSDPSYIEVYIKSERAEIYGETITLSKAVLRLPDYMLRSEIFVYLMEVFSEMFNSIYFDMFSDLRDWAKYVQKDAEAFQKIIHPLGTSAPIPIYDVRRILSASGKSCLKTIAEKILSYSAFSYSPKHLYSLLIKKEEVRVV